MAPPYPAGAVHSEFFAGEWDYMPAQDKGGTSFFNGSYHQSAPRYLGPRRYFALSWLVPAGVGLPAVPLVLGWRRFLRRRKARRLNLCVNCGYDLRASGDRCPECGTVR
jgi:hypothetical protein